MDKLYEAAKKVLPNAYAGYSKLHVAAALKLKNGDIITGVNVENASFGLTNCAERTALFTAYTKGFRKEDIEEIVITTNKDDIISPCGACRQVMGELMEPHAKVHLISADGKKQSLENKDLLPFAFQKEDL
ncbi:MAG: cytidine deaminase [Candidatus Izemoplasma sp.]|nr:cytidine deaminase [Candidatus Izemoplasma sp.]